MHQDRAKPLQEMKQHGSVLFPFTIYPCTIPQDFPSVPLHWQRSMEVIYIKKGRGQVQVGLTVLEAEQGAVFILPPGMLHAIFGVAGERMEYENIIFDVEFLGAGAADVCAQRYLVPLAAGRLAPPSVLRPGQEGYEAVAECLGQLEQLCALRETGYELLVKAAALQLVFLLLRLGTGQVPVDSAATARLKMILQQVEEGYAGQLTVNWAAERCGCSASHFMRWFKQMTGSSFTAYLNERRLAVAAERLRQSSDPVIDIAGEVGFENLSNFNRQFKARYGVTPRSYRKETDEKG